MICASLLHLNYSEPPLGPRRGADDLRGHHAGKKETGATDCWKDNGDVAQIVRKQYVAFEHCFENNEWLRWIEEVNERSFMAILVSVSGC
jgi:hypothetical protein